MTGSSCHSSHRRQPALMNENCSCTENCLFLSLAIESKKNTARTPLTEVLLRSKSSEASGGMLAASIASELIANLIRGNT